MKISLHISNNDKVTENECKCNITVLNGSRHPLRCSFKMRKGVKQKFIRICDNIFNLKK